MSNVEKWAEDFEQKPRRTTLRVLLSALGIIVVVGIAASLIRTALYPAQQAGRVMEKTLDADNMIYNYEWFKQQSQDVLAMDNKLVVAKAARTSFEESAGPRAGWKFDDRQEWSRLNSIVLGLEGQRADMVAKYNARAKMANRQIFMSDDLPSELQ